jgi:Spy/CpxP family protein refolding chaperone
MKAITRNKWFLALLGVLLLGNVALLLSFFVFGERQEGRPLKTEERGFFARELNLDAEQEKQFKEMKEKFFREMEPVWEDIRKTKDSFYRQVNNGALTDDEIADWTQRLAEKNRLSEEKMFRHFRELRKYITPEQQAKYDTILPKMMTRGQRNRK